MISIRISAMAASWNAAGAEIGAPETRRKEGALFSLARWIWS
jgi:hypothetical protein